jgi:hypothetical protein
MQIGQEEKGAEFLQVLSNEKLKEMIMAEKEELRKFLLWAFENCCQEYKQFFTDIFGLIKQNHSYLQKYYHCELIEHFLSAF